jgi:hypothetical protein
MAEILRKGGLVQIMAQEAGRPGKTLVALALNGKPNHRNLRFWYTGGEKVYTSDYSIGSAPSRARVFLETPDSLRVAFVTAGLKKPKIINVAWIGTAYRAAHALHRSFVRGTRTDPRTQTIR